MMVDVIIGIPKGFCDHVDTALLRLRYLYPSWEMSVASGLFKVANVPSSEVPLVQREVNYALYRERIRSEGAPLRELLLKSVMM